MRKRRRKQGAEAGGADRKLRRVMGRKPPGRGPTVGHEQEIVALLHKNKEGLLLNDLMVALSWPRKDRKKLIKLLTDLCGQGLIVCERNKRSEKKYTLPQGTGLLEARLVTHPRGFAFAVLTLPPGGKEPGRANRKDVFISPENLGSAQHRDTVQITIIGRRRGREEGRVVRVLKRANTKLVGIYTAGPTGLVAPVDDRLLFNVVVRKENACGAKSGQAVVVEVTEYKPGRRNPSGRIIEVLGDRNEIAVRNEMVIRKFDLPCDFSETCLAEAEQLTYELPDDDQRRDLRDIPHVTIDGEDARDFDDAVSVVKTSKGFRLHVSIADVSHYVRPGSQLDREAYERGTSVYFPSRVVPMLPERLSNNLCSLVPGEDRLAFTAILDFDQAGHRVGQKFTKSVINSRQRLTYTQVGAILEDQELPAGSKELQALIPDLLEMGRLAGILEKHRMARGSIGFELPEAKVSISEDGQVVEVARAERNAAHKLVEEFMLAANEAVAETLSRSETPSLYRIHEDPEPGRVEEFAEFARTLGLQLPKKITGPAWFGKVLGLVAGMPKEYIVNNLLLRVMQRARYAPENVGHFGLAATHYTHFTSPIRRYPDLMVHRALQGLLGRKRTKLGGAPDLGQAGDFLSDRERTAMEAEREMVDILKARFMADKLGESFDGVISGVTSFGLFIELLGCFISGAVFIETLKDDYYQLDEKHHRLIGANSGRMLQIGDLIRVTVLSVDQNRNRINFGLADESEKEAGK